MSSKLPYTMIEHSVFFSHKSSPLFKFQTLGFRSCILFPFSPSPTFEFLTCSCSWLFLSWIPHCSRVGKVGPSLWLFNNPSESWRSCFGDTIKANIILFEIIFEWNLLRRKSLVISDLSSTAFVVSVDIVQVQEWWLWIDLLPNTRCIAARPLISNLFHFSN